MIAPVTPAVRSHRSPLTALAAALLAATIVAGCGSSSGTSPVVAPSLATIAAVTPTPTPTATSTPTPTPEPTPTPTPAPSQSPVYLDDAVAQRLQQTVASIQTSKAFPGLSVAIDFPDGQIWAGQSGKAIVSAKTPVTADTLFSIGSISKTFVAALVLKLAEEGTLTLDDPLSRYVPTFYLASQITLRELLNHTSGVMDVFAASGMAAAILASKTKTWTVAQVLAKIGKQRYAFAPGKGYKYSNTDYVLLQAVVEKVTGQPIAALIRTDFLQPLGLTSTYLQPEETADALGISNPTSHGYMPPSTKPKDNAAGTMMPFTAETTVVGAAGGFASTPTDLAKWGAALYGGKVLDPASLAEMTDVSQTAKFRPKWVYGLGMEQATVGGQKAWGHRGNLDGYWSATWYLPAYGVTIVISANANWCDPLAVSNSIANVILPAPPSTPSATPSATASAKA